MFKMSEDLEGMDYMQDIVSDVTTKRHKAIDDAIIAFVSKIKINPEQSVEDFLKVNASLFRCEVTNVIKGEASYYYCDVKFLEVK